MASKIFATPFETPEEKQKREKTERRWSRASTGANLLTALAALLAVIIATWSSCQTRSAWQEEKKARKEERETKRPYFTVDIRKDAGRVEIELTNIGIRPAHDISMLTAFIDTGLTSRPEIHRFDDFPNDIPSQVTARREVGDRHSTEDYVVLAIKYEDPILEKRFSHEWLFIESGDSQIPRKEKERVFRKSTIDSLLMDFKGQ